EMPNRKQSLWDARSQKEVAQWPFSGPGLWESLSAALSRDGNWFAVLVEMQEGQQKRSAFKVWNTRTGKEVWQLADTGGQRGFPVRRAQFDPDSRRLATIALPLAEKRLPAAVQLRDLGTGQLLWTHSQI